jgi:hypothetical protein
LLGSIELRYWKSFGFIGKPLVLFLLRNSYDVIGTNVVKPSSEGPSLLATLVCKTLATQVVLVCKTLATQVTLVCKTLAKQFAFVK